MDFGTSGFVGYRPVQHDMEFGAEIGAFGVETVELGLFCVAIKVLTSPGPDASTLVYMKHS